MGVTVIGDASVLHNQPLEIIIASKSKPKNIPLIYWFIAHFHFLVDGLVNILSKKD